MKKILFITIVMMISAGNIFADVTLGAYAGINTGWYNGSDWDDYIDYLENKYGEASNKARLGFSVAGFADFEITDNFSIQPEIKITTYKGGFEIEDNVGDTVELTETNTALVIPVLAKVKFNAGRGKFCLFGGPDLIMILGDVKQKTKIEISGSSSTDKDTYEPDTSVGLGLEIGAGYESPMGNGKFITDLRYSKLLFDTVDNFKAKMDTIGINLGYGFNL